MSKRAEERALEAYPIDMQPIRYQDYIDQFGGKTEIDVNSFLRRLFQEGYEQAEKDLGWISVKDRLPEKNGWYFTCIEQFKIPQCVGITYFDKKTDGWYNEIPMTKRILVSTIEIVDYWMETPKLPKSEK